MAATTPNAGGHGAPMGTFTVQSITFASGAGAVALATGALSVLLGIAVVAWPEATIDVVGILFGIMLIINGVYRVAQAIAVREAAGATRTLYALLGALSFIIGVLALRNLLHTVEILAILFGVFWLVVGVIDFITAVTSHMPAGRAGAIVISILSALAGVVMLAFPGITLLALTWLLGVWLILWGAMTIGFTLWMRHAEKKLAA